MSAVVTKTFEKWLQDFVSFELRVPFDYLEKVIANFVLAIMYTEH